MELNDLILVVLHFFGISLLAVGGAISTMPEIHRFLVDEHHYLTDQGFVNAVSLGQIAPGPNVLFVALMGWNISLYKGFGDQPTTWWQSLAMAAMRRLLMASTPLLTSSRRNTSWPL